MIILPAIDLYSGKAVRLYKGDYSAMTVYNDDPLETAKDFEASGAEYIHIVDLEGAKSGDTPNIATVERIVKGTSLSAEIGGGIRSMETIEKYISIGVKRVILGTAAVVDRQFLTNAVNKYGDRIAVGVDIRDGYVAIKGWTQTSELSCDDFCLQMQNIGVKTIIYTDISKDGTLSGVNAEQLRALAEGTDRKCNIIASGGVHTIEDIKICKEMNLYGTICGKSIYKGTLDLREAISVAKGE